jgi:hypothetical protein
VYRNQVLPTEGRGYFVESGAVGLGTALQDGKFAGSIPGGVIGIFSWSNPTGRCVTMGLTQPLT